MDDSLWYAIKRKRGTSRLDAGIAHTDDYDWVNHSRTGANQNEQIIEWQPTDWQDDAVCHDAPLELFFPGKGQKGNKAAVFCGVCPVREKCLEYARATQSVGVWGGVLIGKDGKESPIV